MIKIASRKSAKSFGALISRPAGLLPGNYGSQKAVCCSRLKRKWPFFHEMFIKNEWLQKNSFFGEPARDLACFLLVKGVIKLFD
jgi:hypothetical protein